MVKINPRSSWGASGRRASSTDPRLVVSHSARTHIVIHHGASAPGKDAAAARSILKSYQNTHFNIGMNDIGYHLAVDYWGNVYAGRPVNERGAHSYPNTPAWGIVYIGNSNNEFSDAAEHAIRECIAYLEGLRGKRLSIVLHRDRQSTACPGSRITARQKAGAFTVRYSPAHIKAVQAELLRLGYDLGSWGADGELGPTTMREVRAFQKAAGLTVDALPGPATLAALKATPTPSPVEPPVAPSPVEPEPVEPPSVPSPVEPPEQPTDPPPPPAQEKPLPNFGRGRILAGSGVVGVVLIVVTILHSCGGVA